MWGARLRRAAPVVAYLALVMAMAWRLWWPSAPERRAFNYDALWQYWGDLQLQIDAVRAGELPLWNPYDRGGYPAHADPQAALLYPVNWGLVALGTATGPAWWLVAVKTVFHLWLMALGTHLFLRRRGVGEAACYVGGGVVVLTYPVSKTLWTALNWGAAWAPWMLLAVDAWAERPTRRRAAALAAVTAMCFLGWAPAASWYALIVVVPYGVWAVVHAHRERGAAWRRAALRSGALAVGLWGAMCAAQLQSTFALTPETVRSQRDLAFVATSAFAADDLFGMLVPRLPGEMAYMGFAVLVLATAAVSLRFDARRLVLAGVAVAGMLLAFGAFAPYLPALASAPGPFDLFRRAHRYLYVTTLPLAVLAAEGLDELAGMEEGARRRALAKVVLVASGVGAVVFAVGWWSAGARGGPGTALRVPYAMAAVSAVVGGGAVAAMLGAGGAGGAGERWRRAAPAVVALVVVGDLYVALWKHREYNWDPLPRTPRDGEVAALAGVPEEVRVYDRELVKYRPGTRLHLRDFGGYEDDPLALRRYALVRDLVAGAPRYLAHLNVGWLLEAGHKATRKGPEDAVALEARGRGVWRVKHVVPAVLWVDRAEVAPDERRALQVLRGLAPGAVVVEGGGLAESDRARIGRADGAVASAPGRIVERSLTRVVVEVDAPADGLVVVHEAYYPGWRATVDGAPARIIPANVLFRAVAVSPGPHRIVLTYPATTWRWLALLSLLALLATLALLALPTRGQEPWS